MIDGAVSLVKGLANSLPTILPILFDAILQAFSGIVDILPEILDALLKATISIINGLAQKLPELIPKIVDAILKIIPVLIQNLPLFIYAGMQLLLGLAKGIVNALPQLIDMIPIIIEDLVGALTDPEMIIEMHIASLKLMLALGKGLIEAIPKLLLMLPEIIIRINRKFYEIIRDTDWGALGKRILEGILNGFGRIGEYLNRKVKEFKDTVTKKFKSIFGIHSPSI